MRIEHHWWNGRTERRWRRDVFIRTDGQRWEVEARLGGESGRSSLHECPGRASADILAKSWMGGRSGWQEVVEATPRAPRSGQ